MLHIRDRLALLTSFIYPFVCFFWVREQILMAFGMESNHKGRPVFDHDASGRCCKTRAILGVVTKIIPNVPLGNQTTDIKFTVAPGSVS
jgi:hypothetical protein